MRVYGVQLDIVWEDKPANHQKVLSLLREAGVGRGALVVLPEMFATGFSMDVAKISEGVDRPSERFMAELSAELEVTVIGGVVNTGPDGRGRNEAVVCAGGREIARYCKLHPFTFGGESKHYASGEREVIVDWRGVAVAPLVCYDLRFPEPFRALVAPDRPAGPAQLFAVIANWPAARQDHWLTLLRARAIENQAYVVGVNRCGADPKLAYAGGSLIVDPKGQVLADAGDQEGIISAQIDIDALKLWRAEFPVLGDVHRRYQRHLPQ